MTSWFEAGDTFSKVHEFWYLIWNFPGVRIIFQTSSFRGIMSVHLLEWYDDRLIFSQNGLQVHGVGVEGAFPAAFVGRWLKGERPIWVFLKIVVPQNGWFELENPIKMDDLGGFYHPYFWFNTHIFLFSASYIRDTKTGPLSPGLLTGDPRIWTVLFFAFLPTVPRVMQIMPGYPWTKSVFWTTGRREDFSQKRH